MLTRRFRLFIFLGAVLLVPRALAQSGAPNEDDDVFVVQAGREYAELTRSAMDDVIMASPAIADGLIVIRTAGSVAGIGSVTSAGR